MFPFKHLLYRLQVTGQSCHGPTHQWAGQGSLLHIRIISLGRVLFAFDQQFSSSTVPLSAWKQVEMRRCLPPPQVAEQAAQSPNFHVKLSSTVEFAARVYSYLIPGFFLPRTST